MVTLFDFKQFQLDIFKNVFGDPFQKGPGIQFPCPEFTPKKSLLKKKNAKKQKKIVEKIITAKTQLKEKIVQKRSNRNLQKKIQERILKDQKETSLVLIVTPKKLEVNASPKKPDELIETKETKSAANSSSKKTEDICSKHPRKIADGKIKTNETKSASNLNSTKNKNFFSKNLQKTTDEKSKPTRPAKETKPATKKTENIYLKHPQKLTDEKSKPQTIVKMTRFELYLKHMKIADEEKNVMVKKSPRLKNKEKVAMKTEIEKKFTVVIEYVDKENSEIDSQEEFLNFLNLARK